MFFEKYNLKFNFQKLKKGQIFVRKKFFVQFFFLENSDFFSVKKMVIKNIPEFFLIFTKKKIFSKIYFGNF